MKNRHYVYVFIVIIIVVVAYLLLKEHKFSWTPTFIHNDTEPYGCELFDSVMSSSLGNRYEVVEDELENVLCMKNHQGKALLCTGSYMTANPKSLFKYIEDGGDVIMATFNLDDDLEALIGLSFEYIDIFAINQPIEGDFIDVTYLNDRNYNQKNYKLSRCIVQEHISGFKEDKDFIKNVEKKYELQKSAVKELKKTRWKDVIISNIQGRKHSLMKTARLGKGNISLISMPLLFTNYGILENHNHELVMRVLNSSQSKKIVRTTFKPDDYVPETSMDLNSDKKSLLNYILSDKSLQSAFYLFLGGLLVFAVFNMRREQRIIPVIKPRKNGQLEFIKQIGSLYKRNKAAENIIMKKYSMLVGKIKNTLHIDITDLANEKDAIDTITKYTGLTSESVRNTLHSIYEYKANIDNEEKNIRNSFKYRREYKNISDETLEYLVSKKKSKTPDKKMVELVDMMNKIDERL